MYMLYDGFGCVLLKVEASGGPCTILSHGVGLGTRVWCVRQGRLTSNAMIVDGCSCYTWALWQEQASTVPGMHGPSMVREHAAIYSWSGPHPLLRAHCRFVTHGVASCNAMLEPTNHQALRVIGVPHPRTTDKWLLPYIQRAHACRLGGCIPQRSREHATCSLAYRTRACSCGPRDDPTASILSTTP